MTSAWKTVGSVLSFMWRHNCTLSFCHVQMFNVFQSLTLSRSSLYFSWWMFVGRGEEVAVVSEMEWIGSQRPFEKKMLTFEPQKHERVNLSLRIFHRSLSVLLGWSSEIMVEKGCDGVVLICTCGHMLAQTSLICFSFSLPFLDPSVN